jgi:chromosome segregation ATPase
MDSKSCIAELRKCSEWAGVADAIEVFVAQKEHTEGRLRDLHTLLTEKGRRISELESALDFYADHFVGAKNDIESLKQQLEIVTAQRDSFGWGKAPHA